MSAALRVATRGSPLARWQAERVVDHLRRAHPHLRAELVVIETTGDRVVDRPLHEIGGQGVFVKEVQTAVLDGRADLAVHSAKDLPSLTLDGLVLASVPERADARDALVGAALTDLAPGATVATGSVRRRAQLAAVRHDLTFVELRGNIATRLGRVPAGGAVVVAAAALDRLGLGERAAERLDPAVVLPQVAQGAIGVECRADDHATVTLLEAIDDVDAHAAVRAERAFLAMLGSGCDLPVGAHATVAAGSLHLDGLVAALDGSVVVRAAADGTDPVAVGRAAAQGLLADAATAALLARASGPRGAPGPVGRIGDPPPGSAP